MTVSHALTLGSNYTVGTGAHPASGTEYVGIVLGRFSPLDDGAWSMDFLPDGQLGLPAFESRTPVSDPYMSGTRWLHGSTDGSNYQIFYTASFNTYAVSSSNITASNWHRLNANGRTIGFFGNWSGSGTKVASATFTITIKKYTGTLGVGETVLEKIIGGNILLSGSGPPL